MNFHEGYKLQSNLITRSISALHSQFTFSATEGFLTSVINTNTAAAYVAREMQTNEMRAINMFTAKVAHAQTNVKYNC